MYATCPHCRASFAITVSHLKTAAGKVPCNQCQRVFDAMASLTETPLTEPSTVQEVVEKPSTGPKPAGRAGVKTGKPAAPPPRVALPRKPPPTGATSGSSPKNGPKNPPGSGQAAGKAAAPGGMAFGGLPIPKVLEEDFKRLLASQKERRYLVARSVAVALLSVALVLQAVWFEPRKALQRYPQFRPWVLSFCQWTKCTPPRYQDLSKMVFVTRDVRAHPDYEGALKVSAALMNQAAFHQPWPRIRFTLFNVNGRTITARSFAPDDYLPGGAGPAEEMAPQQSRQILLELLAPEEEVGISFELHVL